MSKPFSPLLAAETPVLSDGSLNGEYFVGRMPWLASFKYDGIRAVKRPDIAKLVSRTIKPFPSAYVHQTYAHDSLNGLDGELIVPKQHGPTIYHDTYSAVMTEGCTDPVDWLVFDYVDMTMAYDARHECVKTLVWENQEKIPGLKLVEQKLITTLEELLAYEQTALDLGHEGLVCRSLLCPYKYGRSTEKQGWLVKLARKIRFEAIIEDMVEMMHNGNEAIVDPRGYTVRSSHKANLRPSGMCGTLILRRVDTGVLFGCGTGKGFDHTLRKDIFDNWPRDKGKTVMVEAKPYGEKDAPRQPSLLADLVGWRHPIDISAEPKESM